MSRLLSLMICCCLGTALPASAFTYYSEQNMPFNGQDEQGNSTGLAVELLPLTGEQCRRFCVRLLKCRVNRVLDCRLLHEQKIPRLRETHRGRMVRGNEQSGQHHIRYR